MTIPAFQTDYSSYGGIRVRLVELSHEEEVHKNRRTSDFSLASGEEYKSCNVMDINKCLGCLC